MNPALPNTASSFQQIAANVNAALALLAATPLQNNSVPQLGPGARHPAANQPGLTQFVRPGDESHIRHIKLGSKTEPLFVARDIDFHRQPLAKELWEMILKNVDEVGLCRSRQTCRALYHIGGEVKLSPLDPDSVLGLDQRKLCSDRLNPIVEAYKANFGDRQAEVRQVSAFLQKLHDLASHYRCIQVDVLPDFVEAACKALSNAPRWTSLVLGLPDFKGVMCDTSMIRRLEENLAAQGRKAEITLRLADDVADMLWPETLPRQSALRLTGLRVAQSDFASCTPLLELLAGDNTLNYLEVGKSQLALFASLKTGSHGLSHLVFSKVGFIADPAPLLNVLSSKEKLKTLEFRNLEMADNNVTLAALLAAAKGLEQLHFDGCGMGVGASVGSLQALRASKLQVIGFSGRLLGLVERTEAEVAQQHAELLEGLSVAPYLTTLILDTPAHLAPRGLLVLSAFAKNPCAQTLRVGPVAAQRWKTQLEQLNATRQEKGWSAIVIQDLPQSI